MSAFLEIFPVLAKGINITITVLVLSAILSFFIAIFAGLCRVSRFKFVRFLTGVYVEVFRGTSLIVQLFWFYFAIPILFGINFDSILFLDENLVAGVLAISLNYGAYMSEIVRGSIQSVNKGQTEASIALNLTRGQRMRLVIFPQALRMMLPEFGNYLIQMLKATSLVSLIGMTDILYYGDRFSSTNIDMTATVYIMLLLFYFIIAIPLIFLTRKMEAISKKGVAT